MKKQFKHNIEFAYEMFSKRPMGWRLNPQLVDPVIDRQLNHEDTSFINRKSIAEFILNVLAGGKAHWEEVHHWEYVFHRSILPWTRPFCLHFPAFTRWTALSPTPSPSWCSALPPPQSIGAGSSETSKTMSQTKLYLLQLIYLGYFCHSSENLVKTAQEAESWRKAKYESHGKHSHRFLFASVLIMLRSTSYLLVIFSVSSYHSHQVIAHEKGMLTLFTVACSA